MPNRPQTDKAKGRQQTAFRDTPTLSLPKGGGAISGTNENFSHSAFTGAGSFSYSIDVPEARGLKPELSLSYGSNLENGPFGAGWNLDVPWIARKTDKGLPRYQDKEQSDTFLLHGQDDLVPTGPEILIGSFAIGRFHPRLLSDYSRIEYHRPLESGSRGYWVVRTKANVCHVFGLTPEAVLSDPKDSGRVGRWNLEASFDDQGNAVVYYYFRDRVNEDAEDSAIVPAGRRFTNSHLRGIRYGNLKPFLPEADEPLMPQVLELLGSVDSPRSSGWCFHLSFDYGQIPGFGGGAEVELPLRKDPFSNYRFGFEIRNRIVCRRILIHHYLQHEGEPLQSARYDGLVGGIRFDYEESKVLSKLIGITKLGFRRDALAGYVTKDWPTIEFEYTRPREMVFETVPPADRPNLPEGVDSGRFQFVDIDGEGIAGILTRRNDAWSYSRNLGGRFATAQPLPMAPVSFGAPSAGRLMDLTGEAKLDYVHFNRSSAGFFQRSDEGEWLPFEGIPFPPAFNMDDPDLRLIDLTGDGLADILISNEECYFWQPSAGRKGFGLPKKVLKLLNEENGPRCLSAEKLQTIFLADMSGDGLSDIVRIRNGEVCYWPNLGYGRFGAKVVMANAPVMDADGQFDPSRIRLTDVDGSGVTDLIYLGRDGASYWANHVGNSWGERSSIPFAIPHQLASITTTDFYGNGTSCLVWSSSSAGDRDHPIACVDLTGGVKPHLLCASRNNLGAETRVTYRSSTHYYLDDREAGRPWITRLPFPVHVVAQVETIDRVSGNVFTNRYAYHHGFYDGREKEFRGFGMVEQWDTADFGQVGDPATIGTNLAPSSDVPPVLTKRWFHHGAWRVSSSIEQAFKAEYWKGDPDAIDLEDSILPEGLSIEEEREACRSLRGRELRREVYAQDASDAISRSKERSSRPYEVVETNFSVQVIQRRAGTHHAVFSVHDREKVHAHHERLDPPDPRVTHELVLKVDAYGNVEQSLSVGYRRRRPNPELTRVERLEQTQTKIIYTQVSFTNAIDNSSVWRTPLPAQQIKYEIKGRGWSDSLRVVFDDAKTELENNGAGLITIPYSAPQNPASEPSKRRVEHLRTRYRRDDLRDLCSVGELQPMALRGETLRLAFTPDLFDSFVGRLDPQNDIFSALRDRPAGYQEPGAEGEFWISDGREYYSPVASGLPSDAARELAFARRRFFLPHRFENAFGESMIVTYDDPALLPIETVDPVGNKTAVTYDYRVLQPAIHIDPNGNHTKLAYDTLGFLCALALMGKDPEKGEFGNNLEGLKLDLEPADLNAFIADPEGVSTAATGAKVLLANATSRFVIDVGRYARSHPVGAGPKSRLSVFSAHLQHQFLKNAAMIPPKPVKETSKEPSLPGNAKGGQGIEINISYSDGFKREIQHKVLAPPERDPATGKLRDRNRWLGSGWRVFNNKGKPVREYQPFFSDLPAFEIRPEGVSPILFYDPMDRAVATIHPDGSWEKVVFDPWRKEDWDANDTHGLSRRGDPHVGGYFSKLTAEELPDLVLSAETRLKTALHGSTPTVHHFDTLGREFLAVAHNRVDREGTVTDEFARTRTVFDIEGDRLQVHDALDRVTMAWTYDLLGRAIFEDSLDGGRRWHLSDAAGEPLRRWDDRGHRFRFTYDRLHRPKDSYVFQPQLDPATGDPVKAPDNGEVLWKEYLYEQIVYGEDRDATRPDTSPPSASLNLRGKPWKHHDTAGVLEFLRYDINGHLEVSQRTLLANYRVTPDWALAPAFDSSPPRRDLREFDLLGRELVHLTGEVSGGSEYDNYHLVNTRYDVRGQLVSKRVTLDVPGLGMKEYDALRDVDYNERGDRSRLEFGNESGHRVLTTYRYDPKNFRLLHLKSTRAGGNGSLQDLSYEYDPIGNISHVTDAAQQTVYFNNVKASPDGDYTYDALYRLIRAEGREHIGQNLPSGIWDQHRAGTMNPASSCEFAAFPSPSDGQAMRNYTEHYRYDLVGNLEELRHVAGNPGSWTRHYRYETVPGLRDRLNNRLLSTAVGSATTRYTHDLHGNISSLPHLSHLEYDFRDQMRLSGRGAQPCSPEQPDSEGEKTFYVYDASGERVRKVTERNGKKRSERDYFGSIEKHRRFDQAGTLEREMDTLHVSDGESRIVLIETRRRTTSGSRYHLVRGQLSNHLGSSSVEFDFSDQAKVLTYEEYHPFGTTSFSSMRSQQFARKRYRYIGKERDEETGLNYHSARYYAPWLGRWTTADPTGIADGPNRYAYARGNPIAAKDADGKVANFVVQAGVGALIGGGLELGLQMLSGEKLDLKKVALSAAAGAVGGMTGGIVAQAATKIGTIQKIAKLGSAAKTVGTAMQTAAGAAAENITSTVAENVLSSQPASNGLAKSVSVGVGSSLLAPKIAKGLGKLADKVPLLQKATTAGGEIVERAKAAFSKSDAASNSQRVLLDSNVTTGLKRDPTLGGRILPGEIGVKSYITIPEMKNAVSHGNLRGVPGAAYELPTLTTQPTLDVRINIRGMLPDRPGRFGDGIVGAQALENKIPLITEDKALRAAIQTLGGTTR